jgi:copper(I)-binding protein
MEISKMKKQFFLAAALCALPSFALADMVVSDAYARSTGPSSPTGAAFMHITNDTGQDDVITGVMSDAAAKVELHTHIADGDGVMRMVHVEEGFPIAAGETILLERGGKHVMFMGLNAPMEHGAEIEVTFTFETASPLTVTIPVDLDRMPEGHSMSGHGSMGEGHNN